MKLPGNKTKIVCTIGPASNSVEIMEQMIHAGMNIARINLSHGDFNSHRQSIHNLRGVARSLSVNLTIMADLPGPKIRIGLVTPESFELKPGDIFTLTTEDVMGDPTRVSVTFTQLPQVLKTGDILFLNDGIIELEVKTVFFKDVACRVVVGGELRSRKGLNLPGIDLGISAFTERDRECLAFAMEEHIEAISQSFVESAADVTAVRQAAAALGQKPFIIAKIERARALEHVDEILETADGIMIARGDLGVEIPIEQIAIVQKGLTRKANLAGKPVITATQMLESMTINRRPTRAEATDVANAILDGTDCVMLSEESAIGKYPVEAVSMLAKIARTIEPLNHGHAEMEPALPIKIQHKPSTGDLISRGAQSILEHESVACVIIPSRGGSTARRLARLRLPVWIAAVSSLETTCYGLQFSYGIHPEHEPDKPHDWVDFAREWVQNHDVAGHFVILIEGPSSQNPKANHRLEIIDLQQGMGML
jgi:pyruvate kinase